jgi:hypothetical protein
MRLENECRVAFFTAIREREVEGHKLVTAHVHCEDGRAFDASRHAPAPRFMIAERTVTPC